MKRSEKLLGKRIKTIGLFFEIKKSNGISSKRAVLEIAEALSVGTHTVNNDLAKYNRQFMNAIWV